jgi:hypothetical protein
MAIKILILIIASDNLEVYHKLQDLWKRQFGTHTHIDCKFIKANPGLANEYEITEDTVYVKCVEDLTYGITMKTLVAMKALYSEYDFIIRSNLSSFYIFKRLYAQIEMLPTTNCYAGFMGRHGDYNFVSGCGFIVSRDIVECLVNHIDEVWDPEVKHDDVCFGKFIFKNFPDSYHSVARYDLIYGWKPLYACIQEIDTSNVCHIRIKYEPPFPRDVLDVQARLALLSMFGK